MTFPMPMPVGVSGGSTSAILSILRDRRMPFVNLGMPRSESESQVSERVGFEPVMGVEIQTILPEIIGILNGAVEQAINRWRESHIDRQARNEFLDIGIVDRPAARRRKIGQGLDARLGADGG